MASSTIAAMDARSDYTMRYPWCGLKTLGSLNSSVILGILVIGVTAGDEANALTTV